jgi:hypothetical protein
MATGTYDVPAEPGEPGTSYEAVVMATGRYDFPGTSCELVVMATGTYDAPGTSYEPVVMATGTYDVLGEPGTSYEAVVMATGTYDVLGTSYEAVVMATGRYDAPGEPGTSCEPVVMATGTYDAPGTSRAAQEPLRRVPDHGSTFCLTTWTSMTDLAAAPSISPRISPSSSTTVATTVATTVSGGISGGISPRAHDLLARIDAWAGARVARRVLVKIAVTLAGPMLVAAGLAMLVLPGPGLVVIALGLAVLAVEYDWARRLLGRLGHVLGRVRQAAVPREASGGRRLLGLVGVAAFVAGGALATTAITALLGSLALF